MQYTALTSVNKPFKNKDFSVFKPDLEQTAVTEDNSVPCFFITKQERRKNE